MNNTELSNAYAESVVKARSKCEELTERHIEAAEKLATVRDRIARLEQARDALLAGREPGAELDDVSAGRVYAINRDIDTVRPLLATASNEEAEANAALAGSRGQLAAAEMNWRRHQDETLLANLKQRAGQVEALLFDLLRDVTEIGGRLGRPHLRQNWIASNDLRNLVSAGWLPPRTR